jgi:hypothetical protein
MSHLVIIPVEKVNVPDGYAFLRDDVRNWLDEHCATDGYREWFSFRMPIDDKTRFSHLGFGFEDEKMATLFKMVWG